MNPAEALASASAATLRVRSVPPRRSVEVRVVVSGREEDAFAASRVDTLVQALRPILKHLDGRAAVEFVGVEQTARRFGQAEGHKPLADLAEAVAFLCRA